MIGLKRGTVKLKPYNSEWLQAYEKEKKLLVNALGDLVIDIQHVGSTAISGVLAKPIIDIAITVKSLKNARKYIKVLERRGYKYKTDDDKHERLFFTKGPERKRTHYLHIGTARSRYIQDMILFRDYLRQHKKTAKEYANLKFVLAKKFGEDRKIYTSSKTKFVEKIVKRTKNKNNRIQLNGFSQFYKWIREIGTKTPKQMNKIKNFIIAGTGNSRTKILFEPVTSRFPKVYEPCEHSV